MIELSVLPAFAGERLDKFLSLHCTDLSRTRLQDAIRSGEIKVNGLISSQKYKVKESDIVLIDLHVTPAVEDLPEDIPLRIVYEDEAILLINKQAGLTVHPGAGQQTGTLMNALLHYRPALQVLPRAGIVHRLDKNTTGLMVIAKTEAARLQLIADLKEHRVERTYLALVHGSLLSGRTINLPIGRHPVDRKKMAVLEGSHTAKEAVTHIKVLKKFNGYTLVEAKLETGRTHQIRVHLSHLGYPLVGDQIYGRKIRTLEINRQALHALKLGLLHPITQEPLHFEVCLEDDIAKLIEALYNDSF